MLYDDSDQLEVRFVIALAHYDVSIYGGDGGGPVSEGELYIRRNAICLTKRATESEHTEDAQASRPFYLFSENCSDKEDFYLALVIHDEPTSTDGRKPPTPQRFEVRDMISLVQKLHSSEENLQTRWLNAVIGRLFLAVYKTAEIEELVRMKLTRKIARVKKPAFLTDITIQSIHLGGGPPFITNPRLKDLTVDGGCTLELDVDYAGNFRLQIATKARLDLGQRFKAREVDLILALVVKKLEGHAILRFKPPPSNRVWVAFEHMPKMDMSIEPIVSSRQITYNIILRAIESRIREVIAETAVLPNWDDIPFSSSSSQPYRGGIWARKEPGQGEAVKVSTDVPPKTADLGADPKARDSPAAAEVVSKVAEPKRPSTRRRKSDEPPGKTPNKEPAAAASSSSGVDAKPRIDRRKSWRSAPYATAVTPLVSTDTTTVDAFKGKKEKRKDHDDAASKMIAISNRCHSTSPVSSPVGSPPKVAHLAETRSNFSSTSSKGSQASETVEEAWANETLQTPSSLSTSNTADNASVNEAPPVSSAASALRTTDRASANDAPPTPPSASAFKMTDKASVKSMPGFGNDPHLNPSRSSTTVASQTSTSSRRSLSAIGSATVSVAKRWGWPGANRENADSGAVADAAKDEKAGTASRPIGRGRPLPPPGTPLPRPERERSKGHSAAAPVRKPVPSSKSFKLSGDDTPPTPSSSSVSEKRRSASSQQDGGGGGSMLVVPAPPDSQPSSPPSEKSPDQARAESAADVDADSGQLAIRDSPSSSSLVDDQGERTGPRATRSTSRSFHDVDDARPEWLSAQENEARSRDMWIDPEHEGL